MMLKKLVALSLCLMLFVYTTVGVWAQEPDKNIKSLEHLIEYALKNNKDLEKIDTEIQKLAINLRDIKKAAESVKNIDFPVGLAGSIDSQAQTGLAKRGYSLKAAQYNYDLLLEKKEQTKQLLKLGIYQSYLGAIQIQNQKKYLEKSLEKLNKLIQIGELRLKLNMATELEIKTLKEQLDSINNQMVQLSTNEKNMKRDLLNLINAPEDFVVEYIDNFVIDQEQQYDVEKIIEKALELRLDLKQLKNSQELQQLKVDVYKSYYSVGSSTYKLEEIALDTIKNDVSNKMKDIEIEIADKIKNITLLRDTYKISELSLQSAKDKYKTAKLRYDLGLISSLDLMDSELAVMDGYNKSREALFKYIIGKMEYDLVSTYGK